MTENKKATCNSALLLLAPGIVSLGWAIYGFPTEKIGRGLITLAVVTVFFSTLLRIELPRTNLQLTVSDSLVFLALLFYGGEAAVILSMLEAGCSSLYVSPTHPARGFRSWRAILTNVLIAAFSTFVTAAVVKMMFEPSASIIERGDNGRLFLLLAVMALTQFTVNTFLAAAHVAEKTGRKLLAVWNESCFNALGLFCSGAVMAGLSAKALKQIDMVQFILAIGFFGLVYFTYKRYSDDASRSVFQAEQTEAVRAEQAEAHVLELKQVVDELTKTAEELGESRESFRYAAFHDPLTDLPNRNYIVELIAQLLSDNGGPGNGDFAVLLLNLSRFRTINDSLGYHTGDRIIRQVAKRLGELPYDGAVIGHFGGDKYAVILPSRQNTATAQEFADTAAVSIRESIRFKGRQVYTTAKFGIVPSAASYKNAQDILRDADLALYAAKDGHKTWSIFDKSMRSSAVSMQQLETDLRYAIVCNELEAFYQPIVDLHNLTLHGFECLVRWHHPKRGFMSPDEFIPMSEDTGLIIPMTLQILRSACDQLVEWQNVAPEYKSLTMSVNVSGKHFSDSNLVGQIRKILRETNVDPTCLKLEITETSTMEDADNTIEKLKQIRDLGIKLSIDDFGTGYSSLSYLHRFPIDTLKIDRSFVSSMEEAVENDEIVRTVMALAKILNLSVVAEGIENVQQLSNLRRLGCEFGQGYLFSRPVPATAIDRILEDHSNWRNLLFETGFAVDFEKSDYPESGFAN